MLANPPKLKGMKGKGIAYEKHVGRRLKRWQESNELYGELHLGQWFSFWDDNGHGYCQPDILIVRSDLVFILECKLSYTNFAWEQLAKLYQPVVELTFERPAVLVQVCKNLRLEPENLIELPELMDAPRNKFNTWHFLGR